MNKEKVLAIVLILSLSANVYLLFMDHDFLDRNVQSMVNVVTYPLNPYPAATNNTSLLTGSMNDSVNVTLPTVTPIIEPLDGKPNETVPITPIETPTPTPPSDGWTTYNNTNYKFTLRYPITWEINDQSTGSPNKLLILTAPVETNCDTTSAECFKYIASMTILIDQNPETLVLENYFNHAVSALQKDYGITSTSKSASSILSGNRAYQIEFYTRDERGNPMRSYMQYYTIIDQKAYIISYTGPYSNWENVYSHNKGDAQRIVDSFELERVYQPV
jgi:hypothetical protein